MLRRNFLSDPIEPGEMWTDDYGFQYRCDAVRPHINRSGEESLVIDWTCQCAECGTLFAAKTGAKVHAMPRRCKDHLAGKGWERVQPFTGGGTMPASTMAEGQAVFSQLGGLRRRLVEAGDDIGCAAVTLTIAIYGAWREDPIEMRQPTADAEQHLRRAINKLVEAVQDFETPLTAEDLI